MPSSPSVPGLQPSPIERADGRLPVVPESPEQPHLGAPSGHALLSDLQDPANLESFLDDLDRRMAENNASNDTLSPRVTDNHVGARAAGPDPIIVAPNTPRAAVPHTPTGSNQQRQRLSIAGHILVFFGYGRNNKARKELVSLISSLFIDMSQIIAIITLLTVSTHHQSHTDPTQNEWNACGKPLGTWDALWVVRLSLDIWLSIWRWSRERTKRIQDENSHVPNDAETPRSRPSPTTPGGRPQGVSAQRNTSASAEVQPPSTPTPYPRIYARLSLMGSTFTLVWFVLVQILLFSSTNSCRRSSPHLWWLTFGVLSMMYLMILEVVLVAILVFVVGPILFLFWSILLLCLGRHPSQNPHHFTPDVGQVTRAVVDKLPLVIYIPPAPDQPSKPVTLPSDLHSYPPKSATSRRSLFFPFRRRAASAGNMIKSGSTKEKKGSKRSSAWEDHWVRGEYPFVQLDNHRASCAICLLDFQEPRRVSSGPAGSDDPKPPVENQATEAPETRQEGEPEGDITEQAAIGDLALRLQDAGEGAQPLRLLKCGHVFHKTCVDPWLLDVSGRCPVCQRPVRDQGDTTGIEPGAQPQRRQWFRRTRRRPT